MTIDHLVYAAPDLSRAMDAIETLTGVRPVAGGKHTGRGTHNALLSLGPGAYLEIIAPDPQQLDPEQPRAFGLDALSAPRLVTWAAKAPDIERLVDALRAAGYNAGPVVQGHRDLPAGARLEWKLALNPDRPGDGLVPFLIEWLPGAPHPSETAPLGCTLVSLQGRHPDLESVATALVALGIDLQMEWADSPALIGTLETPAGRVQLS